MLIIECVNSICGIGSWVKPSLGGFNMMVMISHGVYIECKHTMWSSSRNLSLIRMFDESVTIERQSFRKILDLYVLKDILQSYWFISLTNSRNSTWTVGIWHINPVIQQQGLILDPECIRIRDAGLLFISGNVSFIHLVWYPQNWLIYYINYFHKFNWNIQLLIYNQVKQKQGLVLDPDFLRIRDSCLLFILGNVRTIHDVSYPQI